MERQVRLQQHLHGVERVAQERHRDASHRSREHIFRGFHERRVERAGRLRRGRGERERRRARVEPRTRLVREGGRADGHLGVRRDDSGPPMRETSC